MLSFNLKPYCFKLTFFKTKFLFGGKRNEVQCICLLKKEHSAELQLVNLSDQVQGH